MADVSKSSNFETLPTKSIAKKVITALSILAVALISKLFANASKYFDVMKVVSYLHNKRYNAAQK